MWHTLIEADNYHALQLLEYLYAGQVDCIYIDPPYNSGATDWKYNNNYVDVADSYRHSKWLSMMKKRLLLAKKILNPKDSVLIVTIDEKEYLHLGCLIEEIFPSACMQMISTVINVKGTARDNEFSRVNEYIFITRIGTCGVNKLSLDSEWLGNVKSSGKNNVRLAGLMRTGTGSGRYDSPGCFYPIIVSKNGGEFIRVGDVYPKNTDRHLLKVGDNEVAIWPIHKDGSEGRWMYQPDGLRGLIKKGYVYFGKLNGDKMGISYAPRGVQKKIESGELKLGGYNEKGSAIIDDSNYEAAYIPGNQWAIQSHNATEYGTKLLLKFIGDTGFPFPKSLYAVHDVLKFFVTNKPNALILDFFAGSGTTLHAVNLINKEDNGHRRCIIVTNNEVFDNEAKALQAKGYHPWDNEWCNKGIARLVTWPRTKCSILGRNINGVKLDGNYIVGDYSMGDGFAANASFFKLSFLDKTSVALGRKLSEMMPVLWLKSGAHGPCPTLEKDETDYFISDNNKFAILIDECAFSKFYEEMNKHAKIETIFFVTDSESGYREMLAKFPGKNTYQLFRDYLDHFSIHTGR